MLRCSGITKRFPGVTSLDGVDFSVAAGEIHALVGENGAGKSTLTKIIAGAYRPDAGALEFDGRSAHWRSPKAARKAGIQVIYQEQILFPDLSVAANVFIGQEPTGVMRLINYRKMREQAASILRSLGAGLDVDEKTANLSVADQQIVEIAKAMVGKVKLLILDEPTAALSGREAEMLFERLTRLRQQGLAIIYISHRLEEIFQLADRVTVLKDGKLVGSENVGNVDRRSLIRMMVGRDLKDLYPKRPESPARGRPVLEVRNLSVGHQVKNISFSVHSGEVLGLAGMVGAGRTELALAIFGALPIVSGSISIDGQVKRRVSPRTSIKNGLALLTEDRKGEGLLLQLDVAANITAPRLTDITRSGFLNLAVEREVAQIQMTKLSIKAPATSASVANLSGGNQQKILFARWTRICDRVLLLDEPTRGVDVGSKAEIYKIIREAAESGRAILMISSELPELIGMCDRVIVMRQGELTGELPARELTEESIMHLAMYQG
jgi:ribose transport system ATP-binding protein